MKIEFLFYRGKSWISKFIKFWTLGQYSHVAIRINDVVYDAWYKKGVVVSKNPLTYHKKNTPIDIVDIDIPSEKGKLFHIFLENQITKKYDFKAIFNFLRNKNRHDENKWFCSELANMIFTFLIPKFKNEGKLVSPRTFHERIVFYKYGGLIKTCHKY